MKSIVLGSLVAVVIAVAAGFVLEGMNPSTAQQNATENVRIN